MINKIIPKDRFSRMLWVSMILLAFFLGWLISNPDSADTNDHSGQNHAQETTWTCSMHPQIQQQQPGDCPICGMDLIPVASQKVIQSTEYDLVLSEYAQKLANIQVSPVERKFVATNLRMVGKIEYDETRLKYITARVPGRIERMYVDYTGISVREGDHLIEMYSPELISTQQELIQTKKAVEESDSELMKQNLSSIRERLRLWGLTAKQIEYLEKSENITDQITIYSPVGGIVIQRDGLEGMYVDVGTAIYTIADLSHVWLEMDAYESDLQFIGYGQEVEFNTEAFPGEIFKGKIAFIDPILDEKTRTVKVRVNVDNHEGKLKPGMFTRAIVKSKIGARGNLLNPDLVGKWISPMHPEIVKDGPGNCDVCGMALVRAEELGYVNEKNKVQEAALVIPASAALITGKRAVVYVQVPGKEGVYQGREVVLGPRAGDYYLVVKGLKEGELVVTNGNFKIDSAIQIMAKPSMMNPEGAKLTSGHSSHQDKTGSISTQNMSDNHEIIKAPAKFISQMDKLYGAYFVLQSDLSHDKLAQAIRTAEILLQDLKEVNEDLLSRSDRILWNKQLDVIKKSTIEIKNAQSLEVSRVAFDKLSRALITVS